MQLTGYLILIVDDDAALRNGVAQALEDEGAQTLTARDGVEALRVLGDQKPSLVLLDLVMPGMSDGRSPITCIRTRRFVTSRSAS